MKTYPKNHPLTLFLVTLAFIFSVCFLKSIEVEAEAIGIDVINADTGENLGDIVGTFSEINLGSLPPHLTLVPAYVEDGTQSVVFFLNGKKVRTENVAPYAIGGDINGDFFPFSIPVGLNNIVIKFYDLPKGKGEILGELSTAFNVINVPIPDVEIKLDPSDLHVALPVGGKKTISFTIDVMIDGPSFDYNLSAYFINEVSEYWISFPSPLKKGQNNVVLNPINLPPDLYDFPIMIKLASTDYPVGVFADAIITIHLQITPSDTPIITDFSLVNANTNQEIFRNYLVGASSDYFSLPPYISFSANTFPAQIGSVIFKYYFEDYDGQKTPTKTRKENIPPYALFGDINGDYNGEPIKGGTYFIQATPYSLPKGKGIAGPTVTLQFYIYGANSSILANVRQLSLTPESTWNNDATPHDKKNLFSFPNSFSDQATISFTPDQNGFVTLDIYDDQGTFVKPLYAGETEIFKTLSFNIKSEGLKEGIYFCRLQQAGKIKTIRLLLKR